MESATSDLSPAKAYHILCSVVAPRPIAWVTSLHGDVVNAAPFSWFQAICADPPMVIVAVSDRDGAPKDTARNAQKTGEFTINIARGEQLADLVATSGNYEPHESEPSALGLDLVPASAVAPPRIKGCAAYLECRLVEARRYGREEGTPTTLLVAKVVHIAMDDALLDERGSLDPRKAGLPARLGGIQYLTVQETFEVARPQR